MISAVLYCNVSHIYKMLNWAQAKEGKFPNIDYLWKKMYVKIVQKNNRVRQVVCISFFNFNDFY